MRLEVVFRGIQCHTTTDDFLEGSQDEVTMNIMAFNPGSVDRGLIDIGDMAEGQIKRFDRTVYFEDILRFEDILFVVSDIDNLPDFESIISNVGDIRALLSSFSESGNDLIGAFSISAKTGSIVWTPRINAENRTPSAIVGFEGNAEFFLNGREGEYSIFFTAAIV